MIQNYQRQDMSRINRMYLDSRERVGKIQRLKKWDDFKVERSHTIDQYL